jgi:hypothetical protein
MQHTIHQEEKPDIYHLHVQVYVPMYCELHFLFRRVCTTSVCSSMQITDQHFKSNLTFCIVCVFTVQTDEWCVHNLLFNVNFEDTPDIVI